MHWFTGELEKVHGFKERYLESQVLNAEEGAAVNSTQKESKEAFFRGLHRLVESIAKRPGVLACFASNEGLLVESYGDTGDFEGLAAMSQLAVNSADKICTTLSLGPLHQTIIVGSKQKVALFSIGEVELGILSLTSTNLTNTLS